MFTLPVFSLFNVLLCISFILQKYILYPALITDLSQAFIRCTHRFPERWSSFNQITKAYHMYFKIPTVSKAVEQSLSTFFIKHFHNYDLSIIFN